MDHIDTKFTQYSRDRKYTAPIRASVHLAKRTLNLYYSLTDIADVYRIAMGNRFALYCSVELIIL